MGLPDTCSSALSTKKGFSPNIWGRDMWHLLRLIAWSHPISTKAHTTHPCIARHYKNFFESLVHVLPCSICCKHYAMIIAGRDAKTGRKKMSKGCVLTKSVACTRQTLTRWLYNVQNCVSKSLNKDSRDRPSYAAVRNQYVTRPLHLSKNKLLELLLYVAWNLPLSMSAKRMHGYRTFFGSLAHVLPERYQREWYTRILWKHPFSRSVGTSVEAKLRLTQWVTSLYTNGIYDHPTYIRVCKSMDRLRR